MSESLSWSPLESGVASLTLRRLLGVRSTEATDAEALQLQAAAAELPSHPGLRLLQLSSPRWAHLGDLYAVWDGQKNLIALDGTSAPVYQANELVHLELTTDTVCDYIRFFCFAVRGADGPFTLFEHAADDLEGEALERAKFARPLQFKQSDDEGRFRVSAAVVYQTSLFDAVFAVAKSGAIEMVDDEPRSDGISSDEIPASPTFASTDAVAALLSKKTAAASGAATAAAPPVPALRVLVELLLERALRAKSTHRLFENFNASLVNANPLEQFASLLTKGFPVVAVETTVPFVEEAIAEIVLFNCRDSDRIPVVAAEPAAGDDSVVTLTLRDTGPMIVLIPLFVYRSISNLDRLTHQLATREISALITCDNVRSLPEGLQQLVDVTLRLPIIDTAIFQSLFTRVMGAPLPPGWDADGAHWVRHVAHTDFEHPRRLKLTPEKSFDYIKAEVLERLSAVDVGQSLGLKDLYGLGEARDFAEDLIADIHAAMRGELAWAHVDRGALLVGAPGTGKTTLARAIAKDCGVRFLTASAATWMATGEHLGHHIRAIRATFAEARRYAPSILFIDEIDGLGNRNLFSGNNAQYLTEVVNAVLEQIQGIDAAMPVFVIAATNHLQNVDPALRRSGRLDRVIQIPLPSSDALALIYKYYIGTLAAEVTVDASVDMRALGGLSLGLTAADVEKIVRGATRRARKARRALGQVDLIAEITNKPRSDQGALRMSPQEIERTAYHEAGHALAQFLSANGGASIGFVTVIPRADGALGFVASLPDERVSLTRQDYIEKIEVFMAGRASEQLHYGEQGISGGASNDLAVATSLAQSMVLKLGFGGDRRLTVSDEVSSKQAEQVETLLGDAYQSILRKLTANEARLKQLATELITRQELTGDDVRKLLGS